MLLWTCFYKPVPEYLPSSYQKEELACPKKRELNRHDSQTTLLIPLSRPTTTTTTTLSPTHMSVHCLLQVAPTPQNIGKVRNKNGVFAVWKYLTYCESGSALVLTDPLLTTPNEYM